jgi:hypothetical protein
MAMALKYSLKPAQKTKGLQESPEAILSTGYPSPYLLLCTKFFQMEEKNAFHPLTKQNPLFLPQEKQSKIK